MAKKTVQLHKNISNFPINRENPFKEDVIAHVQSGVKRIFTTDTSKADMILDHETGEIKGHALFYKEVKIDRAVFTKLYVSSLKEFTDLSKAGLKLLDYIMYMLKPNQDFILFDLDDAKEHTGYNSKRSIINGLSELLEAGFIARGKKTYIYYINPTIYFNGDRIDLVRRYVLADPKVKQKIEPNKTNKLD